LPELHELDFHHRQGFHYYLLLAVSGLEETGLSSNLGFAFVVVPLRFSFYRFSFIAKTPHYRIIF